MKIVNIILTSQNGGAEQVFIDYSIILKRLGHEVFAVIKEDAPYVTELSRLNIPFKKIKNSFGYHDFFAINNIKKILQETNADIVISHIGKSSVLVRKALKKIKNKKILQIAVNHSTNVKRSIGADMIFSVNKNIFYKTVDCGQEADKSFVMYNSLDLSDVDSSLPAIDLTQKKEITLGVIGRLDRTKGFEFAIRAVADLQKNPDKKFTLKIAGSGYYEPVLRALVKELNLENKVEFLGWTSDKKAFFDSIDIFLMTSEEEPFGLVVLEAMKYKKPIISTTADGPKEILRAGKDAVFVELELKETVHERFAEAVIEMVNRKDLPNYLVANSFERLSEKFSYDNLEKCFAELLGRAR
jgi:glycosyltransferase involved in cell wall biosynthesis